MNRIPLIVANWKMNHTLNEGLRFMSQFNNLLSSTENVEIVICPPFTALQTLSVVISEMPKIKLKDFTYDSIKNGRLKKGKAETGLIKFAENISIGKYSSSHIKKSLGFSEDQWKKLVAKLKDTATELHKALLELSVKYQTERNGSRTLAYLVKA